MHLMDTLLRLLKETDIIYKEPVELKNGGKTEYYIDVKKAYGDYAAVAMLAEEMERFLPLDTTCIAASGYGGIRLAGRMCDDNYCMLSMIRDKPKEHGKPGLIDGYEPGTGDNVYIVDDVFTTGNSLRNMVKAIRDTGARVNGCGVVVKRLPGSLDDFRVSIDYIFTEKDFLE